MTTKEKPAPGTRRQQQKAETRMLILNSAKALFIENGYEKTTTRQIATHAGVGMGTVFAHFPDKAALLSEAMRDTLKATLLQAVDSRPKETSVRDQFMHMASAMYSLYATNTELGRVLVKNIFFIPAQSRKAMDDLDAQMFILAGQLVSEGVFRGEVREDVDRDLVVETLFSHYLFVLIQELSAPAFDHAYAMHRLERLVDQAFAGIAP